MGAVRYKDIESTEAQEIRVNGTYDKTEVPRLVEWAADGNVEAFGEGNLQCEPLKASMNFAGSLL